MLRAVVLAACWLVALCCGTTGSAHTVFKKEMQKKYPEVIFKCEACHVKGKPKTERNEFGELFYKQTKDQKLTEAWDKLKGAAKKKYENETMVPSFTKALDEIKKMKKEGAEETYDDLIKALKIENTKKKSDDEDDDDDDDDGDGLPQVAIRDSVISVRTRVISG